MDSIYTILISVGGSSLVTLLWTEQIKHAFAARLEIHKARLNIETLDRIERLRSELQITAAQNSFRFSKVFERTTDVMAETYRNLVAIQKLVAAYKSFPGEDEESKEKRKHIAQQLDKALSDFTDYFIPNEIYLEKQTRKKVLTFLHTLRLAATTFDMLASMARAGNEPESSWQRMQDREEMLHDSIPPLLEALQDEYSRVLGLPIGEPVPAKAETPAKGIPEVP